MDYQHVVDHVKTWQCIAWQFYYDLLVVCPLEQRSQFQFAFVREVEKQIGNRLDSQDLDVVLLILRLREYEFVYSAALQS